MRQDSNLHEIIALFIVLSISYCAFAKGAMPSGHNARFMPCDLVCEYLKDPLGIDCKKPRLSWKFGAPLYSRGKVQTAYHILVSSSESKLGQDIGDMWDSGWVSSSESVNITYNGKELSSDTEYYWKVQIKDETNSISKWSPAAKWRSGIFQEDWTAKWIGSEEMEKKNHHGEPRNNEMYDPWFRKTFFINNNIKEAYIYVASIGYHELYVNGQKASDMVLVPSVTDNKLRARYITYDVTRHLKPGKNVIALWLGTSWSIFHAFQRDDEPAIPLAMVQSDINLSNGEAIRIISDETWKTHQSPNMLLGYWEPHNYGGESYDEKLEEPGWNTESFDDDDWQYAKVFHPRVIVTSDRTEHNTLIKKISPVSIEELSSDTFLIDMGVNYAGWFQIALDGQPGDTITIKFSERKDQDCTFGLLSRYIIGPQKKGTFCNRFNYMAGRWVRIEGLKHKPQPKDISGWLIRPDYKRTGNFECDDSLLNAIYETSIWSFENLSLGNYVVDCPHRERCGYGGDAMATTRPALGNFQLGAFYSKWLEDWRDVQGDDGNVPYTAPTYIGGGGPSWSGFCTILPWEIYRQYRDTLALAKSFPSIQSWLDFLDSKSDNNMLVRWGGKWSFLGDWLWPNSRVERSYMEKQGKALGDTRETLFFNNCYWIYNLQIASKIAGILKDEECSRRYLERAEAVKKAVHNTFYNPEDHSYVNGYPAYLSIALLVDLPPEDIRPQVWKRLEHEILVNRNGHFWGGITGGAFIMEALLENNRDDLIYEMASKNDYPSWGYLLKNSNGTFPEDWECRGSLMHSSYLYIGSWFIESLGGIRRPHSGYQKISIRPWIENAGIKQVKSNYQSMYGNIISNWKKKNHALYLKISIPANTTASLTIPISDANLVKERNKLLKDADGVISYNYNDCGISYLLGSGSYSIKVNMNNTN